ncbi:N-formylglutamate amidohydrolase [Sphingomonas sp. KR1UV-12]|uniref:N-formylglutamate amidohydrolase n=1 Tax=Sphingomonas aurea TaxID=3063994 RepID=A0ABT9EM78_9SPHN|nr:N-formylglutamate amidohydrolase [Sphingomonas sp. KR1UV-12]MDP1028064.1 N-formylglutamate amidohydrolase [Sphingomonas sp. KR1UV-12]
MGSFERLGASVPDTPVIVSVPHAGRDYPAALLPALRVPAGVLTALEDRWVDAVALAARRDETMLIQRRARAWIDLNRGEHERDPRVDDGAVAGHAHASVKVRSGLGLVPRRASGASELWRRRFAATDIEARIAADHRPYHAALEALLCAARARFGTAVLLDLHSMPSLGSGQAQIVLGDRFGHAAAPRLVTRMAAVLKTAGQGVRVAVNAPYAGGHIVERHGRPARGVHAVQLELDRSLYLDARLDQPGAGLAATAAMVRAVIDGLADEVGGLPLAAE